MPQSASALEREAYLRVLLMGAAKVGKSTSTVDSLVKLCGHGYVMVCGDKSGLEPAARRTKKFDYDVVRDENQMESAIKEAKRGVKEKQYNWIVLDDFSLYASWLEGALRDASAAQNAKNEPDGRRYWPEYKQRLMNIPRRLFDVKAHVVIITHFIEQSQEIDGQRAKSGVGIVPMIGGSAREELPALFRDVIFMERKNGKHIFQINPAGVWGPGCRSVDGTREIEASFVAFMKAANESPIKSVSTR